MDKITEINVETKEITERNMTAQEIEQRQKDAELENVRLAKNDQNKKNLISKLLALGLTAEEIKLL